MVELKARFDEENNINWARMLEKAGCHVIYGLVGLKTHSKITLVLRKEDEGIMRYVHLGTGNYNDTTAKIYTDAGFKNIIASTFEENGLEDLKEALKGEVSVLAGASGVGKSSITNILAPKANMDTNTVSRKIERGRHTTRHSELFMIDSDTFVFDTPGFTSVESPTFDKEELRFHFHEFEVYEGKCRFAGCMHINEPDKYC